MTLRDEIEARAAGDAAFAALVVARDDTAVAEVLSVDRVLILKAPVEAAQRVLIKSGAWPRLRRATLDVAHPLFDVAVSAVDLLSVPTRVVDFTDPVAVSMMGALVAGGLMAEADQAALTALSRQPDPVTPDEVTLALGVERRVAP